MYQETKELLEVLVELYSQTDLALFPMAALNALRRVIPCDFLTYNELSLRSQSVNFVAYPPGREAGMRDAETAYWKWKDQHPLTPFLVPGFSSRARTISEFIEVEDLKKLEIYHEFLAPQNVVESMIISVMTTSCTGIFFCFNRSEDSPRFSQHERELADALSPHLIQAFDNAYAFTGSQALALLARGALESSPYGLLLTNESLEIVHRNDAARAMLQRAFGEDGSLLPEVVRRWLVQQPSLLKAKEPLAVPLPGGNRMIFRSSETKNGGWLIAAQEEADASPAQLAERFGLTPREAEVLHWVSQGKSNPEIGIILETSPRTVDKHMQHVLLKLKVDTRMAAIVAALGN